MDQPRIRPTGERPAEQHTTEESLPLSQFEMTFAISSTNQCASRATTTAFGRRNSRIAGETTKNESSNSIQEEL